MSVIASVRPILNLPWAYQLWGTLIGARQYRKTLAKEFIRPTLNSKILDIGCGPGSMFSFLSASEYVGLDSNPEYTLRARRLYPNAQFVCQSVTEYKVPQSEYFDLVLALGIVHHLEDSEAVQLFRIAQTALKPEGRLITLDGIWLPNQSWFSKFLLRIDRGTFVRGEKEYIELALTSFSKIKPTVRHDLLRIPYSHLILECTR